MNAEQSNPGERGEDGPPRGWSLRIMFAAVTSALLVLCAIGGRFGPIGAHPLTLAFGSAHPSIPAGWFILLYALTWGAGLSLLLLLPRNRRSGVTAAWVLGLALLCRLLLMPHETSDDVNRYLWEGRLAGLGVNPYAHPPDDPALARMAQHDPYHADVNHPDMPGAYPPLCVLIFAGVASLWYHPLAIKGVIVAFDTGTLCLLLSMLQRRGRDPRWAVLYALNPVVLYAFAGQAHLDAIQNFWFMAALWAWDRGRWVWMFTLAGLAIQGKYVAMLGVPLFVRRDNWRYAPLLVIPAILPFVPFLAMRDGPVTGSLFKIGTEFAFNGPVHGPLRALFGGIAPASLCVGAMLAAVLLFGYWRFHPDLNPRYRQDPAAGCFFALGALIILSPTVHFWYLAWIVPFLALYPKISWTVLCLTASVYFVTNGISYQTGEWRLPLAAQLVEWAPFGALLLWEGIGAVRRRGAFRASETVIA